MILFSLAVALALTATIALLAVGIAHLWDANAERLKEIVAPSAARSGRVVADIGCCTRMCRPESGADPPRGARRGHPLPNVQRGEGSGL